MISNLFGGFSLDSTIKKLYNVLGRLTYDSSGRLRVYADATVSLNSNQTLTTVTTVTTANIPLVIASVVSILTIFGSSISTITIPFTRLCSAVSIVLMYFTLKSIFGEEKNSEFIKKFALVELVYYIAYIVFSLLNIYI